MSKLEPLTGIRIIPPARIKDKELQPLIDLQKWVNEQISEESLAHRNDLEIKWGVIEI